MIPLASPHRAFARFSPWSSFAFLLAGGLTAAHVVVSRLGESVHWTSWLLATILFVTAGVAIAIGLVGLYPRLAHAEGPVLRVGLAATLAGGFAGVVSMVVLRVGFVGSVATGASIPAVFGPIFIGSIVIFASGTGLGLVVFGTVAREAGGEFATLGWLLSGTGAVVFILVAIELVRLGLDFGIPAFLQSALVSVLVALLIACGAVLGLSSE